MKARTLRRRTCSPELLKLIAEMKRAQVAFGRAGHESTSPEGKPLFNAFWRARQKLWRFSPRTVADVAAKLRGAEISEAGKRGEIKRLARELGCFSEQALAMVVRSLNPEPQDETLSFDWLKHVHRIVMIGDPL
jgi:hypothetical protein